MQHLLYDEAANVRRLAQLPAPLRVAFALLSGMRILPRYRCFHAATGRGDPASLEAIAERLWGDVLGDRMSNDEIKSTADSCLALVPSEEDGWDEATQPFAEDAAAAVAYAVRSRLTGEPQEGAWAARRAYETVERYVVATTGLSLDDPEDELTVLSHPLVQAELARQQRDLEDLTALSAEASTHSALRHLRDRSQQEAAAFLGTGG
jgi:uncharacterized protein YjaG (DUF416 family)